MADNRYGGSRGGAWNDRDLERGRSSERDYRGEERARAGWGGQDGPSRGPSRGGGDEDRGFFERASEEVRSWFGGDDDDRHGSMDRAEQSRQRSMSGSSGGGSDFSRNRGQWGYEDSSRGGGYGREHGSGGFQGDYGSGSGQGGFGGQGDYRGGRQSFSGSSSGSGRFGGSGQSSDRFGYNDMSETMGGFGNQRFGSSQDDHYRSWRDRQIEQLDRDYQEYCRDCEQQFHQNFDSWRQNRQANQGSQGQLSQGQMSQSQNEQSSLSGTGEGSSSGSDTGTSGQSATSTSAASTGSSTGAGGSSSFLGGGADPSAATAGGGGDPTPEPIGGGSTRGSRSRS